MPSTTQQRGSPARVLEAPSHYKRTTAEVPNLTTWNASRTAVASSRWASMAFL